MVKSELINRIAAKQKNLPIKDIEICVNLILEHMSDSLSNNCRIEIRGFGSFSLRYRPPRKAHNPRTGERVYTEDKYSPHFKPGKDLRERVNEHYGEPIIEHADDEDDHFETTQSAYATQYHLKETHQQDDIQQQDYTPNDNDPYKRNNDDEDDSDNKW